MNKTDSFFSQKTTLILSIITVVLLTSQPFGDIMRGAIYTFAALHAFLTFIFSLFYRNEKLDKSIGSYSLICFYILTTIILTAHNDILSKGLTQFHIFFFALNCLIILQDNKLDENLLFVSKVFVILGLYKIIGSFIAILIMKYNPILADSFPKFIAEVIQNSYVNHARPNGITVHPNTLGAIISVASWCSFYLIFASDSKKWLIASCVTIFSGVAFAIRISSRTTLLVITAFIGIFGLLNLIFWNKLSHINKKKLIAIIIIALACIILVAAILIFSNELRHYIFERVIRVKDIKTATGRTNLQKVALEATKDKRLFGMSYEKLSDDILYGTPHTHNPFIQILVTTGIPSLVLFSLFFFYSIGCSIYLIIKKRNEFENLIFLLFILASQITLFIQSFFEQFFFVNYGPVPFFAYIIFPFAIVLKTNHTNQPIKRSAN